MKKAAFILVVCALVLSFSTPALAQRDDYATGFIGATIANDSELSSPRLPSGFDYDLSYDIGFAVGIAAGHDFGDTRFELEIAYLRSDFDEISTSVTGGSVSFGSGSSNDASGDLSILTLLINGYYDFTGNGRTTPYLTAGIGLGSAEVESASVSETDAVTAFQLGAGILYEINETTSVDVRYRYLVTSDIELDIDNIDIEYSSHNVLLGITKRF